MPKRKDYGAEGQEGDQAHAEAMKEFGILEFGASHVQETTIDMRMNYVGLFGHWLKLNKYGKYVKICKRGRNECACTCAKRFEPPLSHGLSHRMSDHDEDPAAAARRGRA